MTAPLTLPRHATIQRAVAALAARGDSSLVLWAGMATALSKIIGDAGFESLFLRSLYQLQPRYPWLVADSVASTHAIDRFAALLATREVQESEQASTELLIIFTDTLNLLIGELVTNRILLAAWGTLVPDAAPESPK